MGVEEYGRELQGQHTAIESTHFSSGTPQGTAFTIPLAANTFVQCAGCDDEGVAGVGSGPLGAGVHGAGLGYLEALEGEAADALWTQLLPLPSAAWRHACLASGRATSNADPAHSHPPLAATPAVTHDDRRNDHVAARCDPAAIPETSNAHLRQRFVSTSSAENFSGSLLPAWWCTGGGGRSEEVEEGVEDAVCGEDVAAG